ncbi:enoyl-CoA hydratase/isomerase family protein [Hymenobacter sp. YC55]|uniref:enoyl-CoA hydratase/isomerase family protein n=1 Tax=Hymenobacter sp. YC55 TaxID=3034019 RepID=UPI0023F98AD9|nr:enoyl-CoA hydratase/isomerase family protein [Hymenobacter sp. YC55]MDF7814234.1 enoyl-CoA hydratase/isomerase family protein [Hymenobacter sp. YC55]
MDTPLSPLPIFQLLHLAIADGVATVRLDNAPVNALSGKMMQELQLLFTDLAARKEVKVILFESANPDFFIAHVDINILEEQAILDELGSAAPEGLNLFQAVGEMLRAQPQVTIVKLKGIARGGGAEFVAAADMSFAGREKGKLAQCEALMGIIPGGGATQYLSSKMTRGRTLEVILGADLFDATTAERYGWINRALPDAELDAFVNHLALNIAALPEGVIETTKKVLPAVRDAGGFQAETEGWAALAFAPKTAQIMKEALQNGAQTVAGERRLEELLRSLDAVKQQG